MSDIESAHQALLADLTAEWAKVKAAYDKHLETASREDIDAYREVQAEWLEIPREVRKLLPGGEQ